MVNGICYGNGIKTTSSQVAVNYSFIVAYHCESGDFSPMSCFGSTLETTLLTLHQPEDHTFVSLLKAVSYPKNNFAGS